jgi:hypothetical protein
MTLDSTPTAIAYLGETIFENLPDAEAKLWPLAFADAIRPGADLSGVIPQFMSWLMLDDTYGLAWQTKDAEIADLVAEVGYRYSIGDTEGEEATDLANRLRAARDARDSMAAGAAWAAWAARGAAWDAWAAWAARDARAALDARYARDAWAAWAAGAAWAARDARDAFVLASREVLLGLLRTAPVAKVSA